MSPPWFASTQTTQHAERFGQAASASSRRRQLTESLALATRPPAWPGRKGRGRLAPGLQLDGVVLVGDDVGVRVATAPAGESGWCWADRSRHCNGHIRLPRRHRSVAEGVAPHHERGARFCPRQPPRCDPGDSSVSREAAGPREPYEGALTSVRPRAVGEPARAGEASAEAHTVVSKKRLNASASSTLSKSNV